MYPKLRLLTWSLLLIAAAARPETARPEIVFSCWLPPGVPAYERLNNLYRAAFDTLGYRFQMHHRPNQRSLMEANAGVTDGECARTVHYSQQQPLSNLIRVDTPIATTTLEVWSHQPGLRLTRIEELIDNRFRIGYVRGHVVVSSLQKQFPQMRLTPVTGAEHGLKMVSAGRLDLFVDTSVSTRQELARLELPRPIYSAGHLVELVGYPYLHKQHQSLATPLATELKRQLPEGGWQFD